MMKQRMTRQVDDSGLVSQPGHSRYVQVFTVDYTAMYSEVGRPLDAITRSIPWLINPEGAQD